MRKNAGAKEIRDCFTTIFPRHIVNSTKNIKTTLFGKCFYGS